MYVLYTGIQSGSVFIDAVLAEAGIAHQRVTIDLRKGEQLTPEFTSINPRQQIVCMRLPDGSVMTEGVAIGLWLDEQHPEARLMPPAGSPERAQALRWLLFLATNLYEGENRKTHPERFTADPDGIAGVKRAATAYVERHCRLVEDAIGVGPYFFGARPSLVDLYLWMLVQWHHDFDWLAQQCPKLHHLVETVMARPKVAPVHLAHFGPGFGLCPIEELEGG